MAAFVSLRNRLSVHVEALFGELKAKSLSSFVCGVYASISFWMFRESIKFPRTGCRIDGGVGAAIQGNVGLISSNYDYLRNARTNALIPVASPSSHLPTAPFQTFPERWFVFRNQWFLGFIGLRLLSSCIPSPLFTFAVNSREAMLGLINGEAEVKWKHRRYNFSFSDAENTDKSTEQEKYLNKILKFH